MKVDFVGTKRSAGDLGQRLCGQDVTLLTDIHDDDDVALLSHGKHKSCYDLGALAQWFVEETLTHNRLPTLPENRVSVPQSVYKTVVDAARERVENFEGTLLYNTQGLTTSRRALVLTGEVTADLSPAKAQMTDEELFDLLPSASELENDDLTMDELVELLEGIDRRRRRRSRGRNNSNRRARNNSSNRSRRRRRRSRR